MIIHAVLALSVHGFDLKLYNKIGVAIENLKDNLIVTHGYQTIPLRVEMRLPQIESDQKQEICSAAANDTFINTVKIATNRFREQIKKELAEFINIEEIGSEGKNRAVTTNENVTASDVIANPSLCRQEHIKCKFFPVMDEPKDGIKEFKARACYDSTLGDLNSKICQIRDGTTLCCSKRMSKNSGMCHSESLRESLAVVNRQNIRYPDRIHEFTHGSVKASDINNFCMAFLWVEIDGNRTRVGRFTDSHELEPKDDDEPVVTTRQRRSDGSETGSENRSRQRRSNWQYYTSGGWFTSNYIDSQISQVKDIVTADTNELQLAIQKNSKTLLTMQADHAEREQLRQAICSASEHLSEELVLAELRSSQSKLEFKSELMLRSCSSRIVPDQIDSKLLTKLCTSQSNSPHCYGKAVRSIFSCELTKPLISMEVVGVSMILTMNIPLDETYQSYRIHSIGVPYQSNAVDVSTNLTTDIINHKMAKAPKENDELEKALRRIFSQLGDGRHRREVVTTYHFLRVDSLPNVVISYENDLISFLDRDCIETPFGVIADYSNNVVEDSECVRAIFDSSIPRITHYCSIHLESSNYPCQVRHIGQIGYLISTTTQLDISDVSTGQKSVFNNKIDNSCVKNVCAVTVGKAPKKFTCGRRIYRIGSHDKIEVNIQTENLKKIKITGLMARKSDRSEMILSGFDVLDKLPLLSKDVVAKTGTISTILTLLASGIMSVLCLKYVSKRMMHAAWYRITTSCQKISFKKARNEDEQLRHHNKVRKTIPEYQQKFNGSLKNMFKSA